MSGITSAMAQPRQLRTFVLVALGFSFIGIQDGALGVLLPSLQRAYGLSMSGVGVVFIAAMAGYLVAATLTGPLLARLGPRAFLTAGSLAVLLGFGLVVVAPPWPVVVGALAVAGVGTAMLDAGLNAHVAGLPESGALLNYVHAIYGGGALAGPLIASQVIVVGGGWELIYAAMATLAFVLALGFALGFRSKAAGPMAMAGPMALANHGVLAEALGMPVLRAVALFVALYLGVEVTVGSWSFSVLTEVRGQSMEAAGWMASAYWVGLTAGRLLLGRLVQHNGGLRLVQLCLPGVAIGMLGLWLLPGPVATLLCLLLTGLCIGPIYPTTIAVVAGVVPARLLPAVIGLLTTVGAVGGSVLPWLAGTLAMGAGVGVLPPLVALLAAVLVLIWWRFAHSAASMPRCELPVQTCRRAVAQAGMVEPL